MQEAYSVLCANNGESDPVYQEAAIQPLRDVEEIGWIASPPADVIGSSIVEDCVEAAVINRRCSNLTAPDRYTRQWT